MATTYVQGAAVKLQATVTITASGAEYDPAAIALHVKDPSDNITTYAKAQLTQTGTNVFSKLILANEVGVWRYGFKDATSGAELAKQGWFKVEDWAQD